MMPFYMFTGMFLFQYIFSSFIMTNDINNISNSIGKIYMSIIMGLFMVLLDMLIGHKNLQQVGMVLGLFLFFIYLYRIQFGVDEKNYIREMIEHHSMALLTSKNILEKTKNPAVINFATSILVGQEKEIGDMRYLLKSI
jgi:hypothetical protein